MHTELKELYVRLADSGLDEHERRDTLLEAVALLAELLAAPLHLMGDEVAIQAVIGDGSSLRFLFPVVLYESGATFPITSSSIAGLAVQRKRSKIENKAAETKRLMFYEKLNTGVRPPLPIQKMISIPLVSNDTVVGIVQLSRRAASHDKAGADFTEQDLTTLREPLTLAAALLADHVHGKM